MIIDGYYENEHSHRTVNGPVNLTWNYNLKLLFFSNVQYMNRTPFVIVFIKENDIGIDKSRSQGFLQNLL